MRRRVTGVVVGLLAFGAGGGAGVWAPPDAGPIAAVLGAWDTVTGASQIEAADAATDGPEPVGIAMDGTWFADRTGTGRSSRLLVGARRLAPGWADGMNDLIAPSAVAPTATPAVVDGLLATDISAGLLSIAVPSAASGDVVVVPGAQPAPGPGAVRTVRIEVEQGLAVDPGRFALTVMTTLNDPRGWGADGSISFARTDGDADLRIVLASPHLVDQLCAPLETLGKVSCGSNGRAVLNMLRWAEGANGWDGDTVAYRQYLVNHEVGHLLGHGHEYCPGAGQLAPLMQQQSGSIGPCTANPWPFPTA
jgi:hypothetical protein